MLLPSRACVLELVRIRCPVRCKREPLASSSAQCRCCNRSPAEAAGFCRCGGSGGRPSCCSECRPARLGLRSGSCGTMRSVPLSPKRGISPLSWPASCRAPSSRSTPFLMEVKRSTKGSGLETTSGFRTAFEHQDFHESLTEYRNRLPQTFNLAIADRDGNLTVSTAAWPTPAINIVDRDYFQEARDRPGDVSCTSIPIKNRINGIPDNRFRAPARESERGLRRSDIRGRELANISKHIYGSIHSVHSISYSRCSRRMERFCSAIRNVRILPAGGYPLKRAGCRSGRARSRASACMRKPTAMCDMCRCGAMPGVPALRQHLGDRGCAALAGWLGPRRRDRIGQRDPAAVLDLLAGRDHAEGPATQHVRGVADRRNRISSTRRSTTCRRA